MVDGEGEDWMRTDWLGAAEWYVDCAAERAYEDAHGPIHSYSGRLPEWDSRMWDRAWVNRIALFLRRWAARTAQRDENALFGPVPDPEILITHDVDAVAKTASLRIKQSGFHLYNAGRSLGRGAVREAVTKGVAAGRFLLGPGDLWNFDVITSLEEQRGIRSHFYFYGGRVPWRRSPRRMLVDPAYDILDDSVRRQVRALVDRGWTVGLHQSFDAWRDPAMMLQERVHVETAAGRHIDACRQHWLRFAFADTWRAQREAGFRLDSTLGFNDRPSFRNGAALRWRALDGEEFESLPMVLMDSHLYDYAQISAEERRVELAKWIGEIRAVRGCASVLWHQQTCSDAYGWTEGFIDLLDEVCR